MWRIKKLFSVLIVFIITFSSYLICYNVKGNENINISAEQYEKGYRYNTKGWIYVYIEGEPYERGFQHGYLLSDEIVDMLNRWSNTIHNHETINRISNRISEKRYKDISETWWNFCRNQCKRLYLNKFPNEYREEIRGIADGANSNRGSIHGRAIDELDILTMNEMYELMSKLTSYGKRFHPIRTLFHNIMKVEPIATKSGLFDFIINFFSGEPPHHCNGFAATGDATTDGQIVFSQSTICGGGVWWWNYYINLRWNVILDINPNKGNRVIISTSPGLIWSDEDYYQNDNGILLLETTNPQGIYDNIGLPLSVRARNAMQYGNSIDDVIYYLRYRNDGSMNAVWLIGDTKTGEIARLDLGYSAYKTYRTKNGFYWSANNPIDLRVRLEKFTFDLDYIYNLLNWIFNRNRVFGYYSIRYIPAGRDIEYERLGNKYYGKIDIDVLKEIMSIRSISYAITDIKLTDTELLEKNGLWAFFGNPLKKLDYINFDNQSFQKQTVKPNGWVEVIGLSEDKDFKLDNSPNFDNIETDILWEYDTGFNVNDFESRITINNNILYTTSSEGKVFAINIDNKDCTWQHFVGEKPTKPTIQDEMIFIGHSEGIIAFDINGFFKWNINTTDVTSIPIVIEDILIFGTNSGSIYALSVNDGKEKWSIDFEDNVYISSYFDNNLYVASGEKCYAISLENQKIKWTFSTDGLIRTAPSVSDNLVYIASTDNNLYCLDKKTGQEKWRFETGWSIYTTPAISDTLVFVGSKDNNIYALNKEIGDLVWTFSCNGAIHTSPVLYGTNIFFGSDDGRVYALNMSDGKYIWSFAPDQTVGFDLLNYITTPIVTDLEFNDDILYMGANGTIFGLNPQTYGFYKDVLKKDKDIPFETWLFIIISISLVITITIIYLVISKKRVK